MSKQELVDAIDAALEEAHKSYRSLVTKLAITEAAKKGSNPRVLADTSKIAEASSRIAELEKAREYLDRGTAEGG